MSSRVLALALYFLCWPPGSQNKEDWGLSAPRLRVSGPPGRTRYAHKLRLHTSTHCFSFSKFLLQLDLKHLKQQQKKGIWLYSLIPGDSSYPFGISGRGKEFVYVCLAGHPSALWPNTSESSKGRKTHIIC